MHVKVGNPPTSFYVNSDLLTQGSEFFKAALKKRWPHSIRRSITLSDVRPELFNVYFNWIHRHRITVALNNDQSLKDLSPWPVMIEAYALGDFLLNADFKDALTDAMALTTMPSADGVWQFPPTPFRRLLYNTTTPGSKARDLLVHTMRRTSSHHLTFDDDPALLRDIAEARRKQQLRADSGAVVLPPKFTHLAAAECVFHEHPPGAENCYRARYAPAAERSLGVETAGFFSFDKMFYALSEAVVREQRVAWANGVVERLNGEGEWL